MPVWLCRSNQQPRRVLREKLDEHDEHLPALVTGDFVAVVDAVGDVRMIAGGAVHGVVFQYA
jgi:hypothetical protein